MTLHNPIRPGGEGSHVVSGTVHHVNTPSVPVTSSHVPTRTEHDAALFHDRVVEAERRRQQKAAEAGEEVQDLMAEVSDFADRVYEKVMIIEDKVEALQVLSAMGSDFADAAIAALQMVLEDIVWQIFEKFYNMISDTWEAISASFNEGQRTTYFNQIGPAIENWLVAQTIPIENGETPWPNYTEMDDYENTVEEAVSMDDDDGGYFDRAFSDTTQEPVPEGDSLIELAREAKMVADALGGE